jgi:hypothetical protein
MEQDGEAMSEQKRCGGCGFVSQQDVIGPPIGEFCPGCEDCQPDEITRSDNVTWRTQPQTSDFRMTCEWLRQAAARMVKKR